MSGTFQGIANGGIVQAIGDSGPTCTSGSPPYLQINYGTSTVTATVVAAPPAGGSARSGARAASLVPHLVGNAVHFVPEG